VEEGRGWFHLSAGFEIDGETFELQPILAALVANRFLDITEGMPAGQEFMIFLPDGRGLALPVGRFRGILTTLGELMEFKFPGGPIRLGKLDAALLAGEGGAGLAAAAPPEITDLAARIGSFDRIERLHEPAGLRANLREYQLDGYHWLQFLCRHRLHGILADDMGLGKTIQTLAHLVAEKEAGHAAGLPSLVVAPTSVVPNWQRRSRALRPGLRVLVLQGRRAPRPIRRNRRRRPRAHFLCPGPARSRATSPNTPSTSSSSTNPNTSKTPPPKPPRPSAPSAPTSASPQRHPAAKPPRRTLEPDALPHARLPRPARGFQPLVPPADRKDGDPHRQQALNRRIAPLLLRRTKDRVAADLPPKTELAHGIELSPRQIELYESVRAAMDERVRKAVANRGLAQSQIVLLDALLKLRQICCHPGLLQTDSRADDSAKFDHLVDLLDTFRQEGNRVLLFSQFTSMLSLIEAHLVAAGLAWLKLTGSTKNRAPLVERFQAGEGPLSDLPQGRRHRPHPDRRRHRDPLRPVVESRRREPGQRPRPPHRSTSRCSSTSSSAGHRRGTHPADAGPQG
jgi:hypothetical protein